MLKPILTIPFVLGLWACSNSQEVSQAAPTVNTVALNSAFHINLPENHSSGYLWQLDKTSDRSGAEYINSVWHGNEKGVMFNFRSLEKGRVNLTFDLIKYKDTADTRSYVIEVK